MDLASVFRAIWCFLWHYDVNRNRRIPMSSSSCRHEGCPFYRELTPLEVLMSGPDLPKEIRDALKRML